MSQKKTKPMHPETKSRSVAAIVAGEGQFGNNTTLEDLMKILECEHCGKGLKIEHLKGYNPPALKILRSHSYNDHLLDKHGLRAAIDSYDRNTVRLVDAETEDPVSTIRIQKYLADLRQSSPDALPALPISLIDFPPCLWRELSTRPHPLIGIHVRTQLPPLPEWRWIVAKKQRSIAAVRKAAARSNRSKAKHKEPLPPTIHAYRSRRVENQGDDVMEAATIESTWEYNMPSKE
jgi:hypothetical protein